MEHVVIVYMLTNDAAFHSLTGDSVHKTRKFHKTLYIFQYNYKHGKITVGNTKVYITLGTEI